MTHQNGILQEFERRIPTITETSLKAGRQRLADVAAELSRRGAIQARAELCNEAVAKLIELCFERDTDGVACNVDPRTARILIPLPWGERGHQLYGLRSTEGRTLRRYVLKLQEFPEAAPLFIYDPASRSWYLNVWDGFTEFNQALTYWQSWQLNTKAYKALQQVR